MCIYRPQNRICTDFELADSLKDEPLVNHSEIDFEYDWRNEVLNIYASEGAADIPFDLDNYDTLDEFIGPTFCPLGLATIQFVRLRCSV